MDLPVYGAARDDLDVPQLVGGGRGYLQFGTATSWLKLLCRSSWRSITAHDWRLHYRTAKPMACHLKHENFIFFLVIDIEMHVHC